MTIPEILTEIRNKVPSIFEELRNNKNFKDLVRHELTRYGCCKFDLQTTTQPMHVRVRVIEHSTNKYIMVEVDGEVAEVREI